MLPLFEGRSLGNSGKVRERQLAREMRAQGAKLIDICNELKVSKSSASVWVRDVPFVAQKRRASAHRRPHAQAVAKQLEIQAGIEAGHAYFEKMSRREFFAAGIALYAGEGSKSHLTVSMANTNPEILKFFTTWLRTFFFIDERKFRGKLYLHSNLNIEKATKHWSDLLKIPESQFTKPYRALNDPTRRKSTHVNGCMTVTYHSAPLVRQILGYMDGLLKCTNFPG